MIREVAGDSGGDTIFDCDFGGTFGPGSAGQTVAP